jgi:hypothetical protein
VKQLLASSWRQFPDLTSFTMCSSQFCNAIITTDLPVLAAAAIDSWLQTVDKRVDASAEAPILKVKQQLARSFSSDAINGAVLLLLAANVCSLLLCICDPHGLGFKRDLLNS